jgi:hypothetical protein
MEDDSEDDVEFDSGPFCIHWGDPSDCQEMCKCGHPCHNHSIWDDERSCNIEGCDCNGFEDIEDDNE